jgi:hypothetical protein
MLQRQGETIFPFITIFCFFHFLWNMVQIGFILRGISLAQPLDRAITGTLVEKSFGRGITI